MNREHMVALRYNSPKRAVPKTLTSVYPSMADHQHVLNGESLSRLEMNLSSEIGPMSLRGLTNRPYDATTLDYLRSTRNPDLVYLRSEEGYCVMRLVRMIEFDVVEDSFPNWHVEDVGNLNQTIVYDSCVCINQ